ncbi:20911_t:CDS:1, partial [Entrophospora sp. SA101]
GVARDLEIKEVDDTILEQINYRWHDPIMTALAATFRPMI